MIACIILATFFFALVGLAVLNHAIKKAPIAYEDRNGFHEIESQRAARLAPSEGFPALGLQTRSPW